MGEGTIYKIPIHARQIEDWPQRSVGAFRPRFLLPRRKFGLSRRANEAHEFKSSERNTNGQEPRNGAWDRASKQAIRLKTYKRQIRHVAGNIDRYVWVRQR